MNKQSQNKLIQIAKSCLGKTYKYGAGQEEAPEAFDCSSFVQYLYKQIKIELPRRSLEQAHIGEEVSLKKLEVGDLLFFHGTVGAYNLGFPTGIGHVALYIGDNQIIQAAKSGEDSFGKEIGDVRIEPLENILNKNDLVVIKRLLK